MLLEGDVLEEALLAELEGVADRNPGREPLRGFTAALDSLRREATPDALVVVARHEDGTIGAFLHFVPTFGRAAVSLTAMSRRPDTPNGLFDYLVARSTELLRGRGIGEVSLSSAVRARSLREQRRVTDHLVASIVRRADRRYRFERFHRFNAKFHPRWEPRYLVYENRRSLARTAIAALSASGLLPTPSRSRRTIGETVTAPTGCTVAVTTLGCEE